MALLYCPRLAASRAKVTQDGSASPEPWRFDPVLDYETPFGVTDCRRRRAPPPQTFKQVAHLAWVWCQGFFYVRNTLPRGQSFHSQTLFRYNLLHLQCCHPEPASRIQVIPCGALRNRDFVPQVGLICALATLNPTET